MNRITLLKQLSDFSKTATGDIIMPVRLQEGDTEQTFRAAGVHLMRLKNSKAAQKTAPYIIHQIITGKDVQPKGEPVSSTATVRSIFAVYNEDEQEGGLMLLNLMERLRISLLKAVVIGRQYELDLEAGIETIIYPDDTAPYYAGEMASTWKLPAVKREVVF